MTSVVLAHVSDLHLPFEPQLTLLQRLSKRQLSAWSWQRRRHLHRPEILEALVTDLRAHAVDHVVVTGDITNFSLPGEFRQAVDWLQRLEPSPGALSLVPGNHDALVPVARAESLDLWRRWTGPGWPYVHRVGGVALIGLNSATTTAPLLAQGQLGAGQIQALRGILRREREAGYRRVVLIHHPPAEGAIGWRKALRDRSALQAVLREDGAELLLHGHARDARLDALPGPRGPIPCLCVPSSSAVPNPRDGGARWHRLVLKGPEVAVTVRGWSVAAAAFVEQARYTLHLP